MPVFYKCICSTACCNGRNVSHSRFFLQSYKIPLVMLYSARLCIDDVHGPPCPFSVTLHSPVEFHLLHLPSFTSSTFSIIRLALFFFFLALVKLSLMCFHRFLESVPTSPTIVSVPYCIVHTTELNVFIQCPAHAPSHILTLSCHVYSQRMYTY